MKTFAFPTGKDPALLFGCGRFRMEEHLLENCAGEIVRFGRRPLIVCDDNSHRVAFETVAASLRAAGAESRELRHNGFCCREDAIAYAEAGAIDGIDMVLGCGGGVILDFSKCLAHLADVPLVTIPTSSAQCCAYTTIAACYTHEGRYASTSHFSREAVVALLDLTILSRQPPRLLAAGALDAMAKKIELEFWDDLDRLGGTGAKGGAGVASEIASAISDCIYGDLDVKIDAAMADLAKGEPTQTLRDVIFASIVGAGIVSGISGGSRQVALAHRLYYCLKSLHPAEASRYTHGELVAMGLVMQHTYNGKPAEAETLAARLRGWGLPTTLGDMGLPSNPEELEACAAFIDATKTMKAAVAVDPAAPAKLREALKVVF